MIVSNTCRSDRYSGQNQLGDTVDNKLMRTYICYFLCIIYAVYLRQQNNVYIQKYNRGERVDMNLPPSVYITGRILHISYGFYCARMPYFLHTGSQKSPKSATMA